MTHEFLKLRQDFSSLAIHGGQNPENWKSEAVAPPIVMSSSFKLSSPEDRSGFRYGRLGNPSRNSLEECLAEIEGAKHAFALSSGHGATATIAALLSAGDHLLASEDLYGGTIQLFSMILVRFGIEVTFADFTDLESLRNQFKENTKMIWFETPTNPVMKVIDIAAVATLAKNQGDIIVAVDNSVLTSYLQRPLEFGADIVMYSISKYINGHSDIIMGAALVNDDKLAERLRVLQIGLGTIPSPYDCSMVNRSLRTLAVRMEQHSKSALIIAKWLQNQPNVVKVLHPGLPSHQHYEISKKQTSGNSGVFSFYHSGGIEESRRFLSALKMFILADSYGAYESLAGLPYAMSHEYLPPSKKAKAGITDSLIRLSVGLENIEDLIKDLDQALKQVF